MLSVLSFFVIWVLSEFFPGVYVALWPVRVSAFVSALPQGRRWGVLSTVNVLSRSCFFSFEVGACCIVQAGLIHRLPATNYLTVGITGKMTWFFYKKKKKHIYWGRGDLPWHAYGIRRQWLGVRVLFPLLFVFIKHGWQAPWPDDPVHQPDLTVSAFLTSD